MRPRSVRPLLSRGDPKIYNSGWADGESILLYRVKKILNAQGYDFIKKRMWKDGHLVDNLQQYLQEWNLRADRVIAIYNQNYALWGAHEQYNANGRVVLQAIDISQRKTRLAMKEAS